MGLHTGIGALGASDYVGLDVHRAARIADSAHGGQVVLSEPTAVLVERSLPEGVSLRDLGKHRLKDLAEPEAILQVVSPGLQSEFPLLRTLDAIPNNLPKLLTSFVGRDRELAEAVRLLGADPAPDLHRPRRDRQDPAFAATGSRGWQTGTPMGCSSSISPRSTMWRSSHRGSWRRWAFRSRPGRSHRRFVSTVNWPTRASCSSWTTSSSCSTGRRWSPSCCGPRHVPRCWSRLGHRFGSAGSRSSRCPLSGSPGSILVRISTTLMHSEAIRLFTDRAMAVRPDFRLTVDIAPAVAELVAPSRWPAPCHRAGGIEASPAACRPDPVPSRAPAC